MVMLLLVYGEDICLYIYIYIYTYTLTFILIDVYDEDIDGDIIYNGV